MTTTAVSPPKLITHVKGGATAVPRACCADQQGCEYGEGCGTGHPAGLRAHCDNVCGLD